MTSGGGGWRAVPQGGWQSTGDGLPGGPGTSAPTRVGRSLTNRGPFEPRPMWPWEHAVVGYLAFSVGVHLVRRRPPTGPEALVVAFAAVAPDLVDKPLAWEFGVFPSGHGIAHSVFFAVPLVALVLAAAARRRPGVGTAFAVGYLSHLAADVLQMYIRDRSLPIEWLLWPVRTVRTDYPGGFTDTLAGYLRSYLAELTADEPSTYVLVVVGLTAFAVVLWVYDGLPGVRGPAVALRRRL